MKKEVTKVIDFNKNCNNGLNNRMREISISDNIDKQNNFDIETLNRFHSISDELEEVDNCYGNKTTDEIINKKIDEEAKKEDKSERDTENEIYVEEKMQITVGNEKNIEPGVNVKERNVNVSEGKEEEKVTQKEVIKKERKKKNMRKDKDHNEQIIHEKIDDITEEIVHVIEMEHTVEQLLSEDEQEKDKNATMKSKEMERKTKNKQEKLNNEIEMKMEVTKIFNFNKDTSYIASDEYKSKSDEYESESDEYESKSDKCNFVNPTDVVAPKNSAGIKAKFSEHRGCFEIPFDYNLFFLPESKELDNENVRLLLLAAIPKNLNIKYPLLFGTFRKNNYVTYAECRNTKCKQKF